LGISSPMSLTELALLDGRRPLPSWDVIGLTLTLTLQVALLWRFVLSDGACSPPTSNCPLLPEVHVDIYFSSYLRPTMNAKRNKDDIKSTAIRKKRRVISLGDKLRV
jgi:hypothetical protein